MSLKKYSARYLLFLIGVTVGLVFFISLNMTRRQDMEALGQKAFHNYLQSNLYSMSTGYFQWDEFKNAVDDGNQIFIEKSFADIQDDFPFVSSIKIVDGSVDGFFEFKETEDVVYVNFSVYDSDGINKTNEVIEVVVDPEMVLTVLYDNDTFYEISHDNENDQMNLVINEPLLNWGHYISTIMIGIMFSFVGSLIYRQTIRNHYQLDGLKSILNLLSKRDFYTADHSEEVAELAIMIAKKLDFPRNYVATLYAAGILHDIGKVGINDSIINKNGKLTEEEWKTIKEHPQLGYEIVSGFTGLEEIAIIVRQHHEKLDGSGYPDGLKEGQISSLAQILAVADIYSAIKSDRPYRPAFADEEAFKLLKEMSVNQEVVSTLEEIILEDN